MATPLNHLTLLPIPRRVELFDGEYRLDAGRRIALLGAPAATLLFSGERLRRALNEWAGVEWTPAAAVAGPRAETGAILQVDSPRFKHPQAYEVEIGDNGIRVVAGSPHGIFNGVCTLIQIVQQAGRTLPRLHISDAPDYSQRGVMLDISRDKVPAMATLFDLVDLLAAWKVNQLQLYTEHTFAYRNHPVVWESAAPMTEHEILELDAFCRERFVELVPNQNSFGHLHRWLKHAEYRGLAECPDGFAVPHAWGRDPFSLNPTDARSLDWIRGLYDELLPNFSSRQFNAGCDETFDLGQGASRAECERRGTGAVYLAWIQKIHAEVNAHGRTMQFWGDIVLQHPDLVAQLPRDAIALDWGYEADHPFDAECAQFARAGIPFYVCPGTSSWNSILGRTDNAVANIANAAESGLKHGAMGLLNTDWGDNGHWQFLPISYLGFAYGSAMSWCVATNRDLDLPRVLDAFAFRDAEGKMGRAAFDLGNAYQRLGAPEANGSALGRNWLRTLAQIRTGSSATPEGLTQTLAAIDAAVAPVANAKTTRSDAGLIVEEFQCAAQFARHGARRGLLALEQDPTRAAMLKRELAADLIKIKQQFGLLWHARNRPGGFRDSVARLTGALDAYLD